MKKSVILFFAILFFWSCSHNNISESNSLSSTHEDFEYESNQGIVDVIYAPCVDRQAVKVLNNEPAVVRQYNIFQTEGKEISLTIEAASIDTFVFELKNHYEGVSPIPIISRYAVPKKYRIDGLEVKISGNITNCYVGLSSPTARFMPHNIFELTSIK